MKKIISIVLLLTLCLGLFAGCTEPAEPTSDLANAKALLFSKYKPASKDEIPAKSADFEVVTSVLVDGVSYPVEWTVAVTSGAADAVKIVDGSSAAFKKIDLTEKPESEIQFTLTAVIKDSKGNSETLEFKFKTPAFEAPTAEKVVIKIVADNKYATGTEYEYTSSSSGNVKMELNLSENKAEALPLTMINNADGTVTFKTDCGKFLFCDANSVEYVSEESDYTKFVLEAADGGYFIKCAVANYNGNPQYLEVYSGYLTCYSMNESSNLALYIFALEDATGAAGTVVELTPGQTPDDPENPDVPVVPSTGIVENPEAGKAYKFGMVQAKAGKTVYLIGGMDGFYMATSEDVTKAIDVYLEATEGGYYLYVMVDGAKQYINMVVTTGNDGKTHVNAAYEATASTVYTWDAEHKTVVSDVTVGDKTEPYWHGTRNDKTYTTMGPCAVSYAGFYGQFYTVENGSAPENPETPDEPETPSKPADATISFDNTANRTVMTDDQQVWVQNGITFTNSKGESTQPVKDYSAPVRIYAKTSLKVEYKGMKTIKFHCNTDDKTVNGLVDSMKDIQGITVTVEGNVVTVTFTNAVDSFEIVYVVAQFRINKIEIFK